MNELSLSNSIDKEKEFFISKSIKNNNDYLSIDKHTFKKIILYFLKISDVYLKPQTIIPKIIYFLHIHKISYPNELSKFFNYSYGSLQLMLRKLLDLGIIEFVDDYQEVKDVLSLISLRESKAPLTKIRFIKISDRFKSLYDGLIYEILIELCSSEFLDSVTKQMIESYRRVNKNLNVKVEVVEKISPTIQRVKESYEKREREERRKKLFEVLATVPEVTSLTVEQVKDGKFMMDLVIKLREKYKQLSELRITVTDLRDYYLSQSSSKLWFLQPGKKV